VTNHLLDRHTVPQQLERAHRARSHILPDRHAAKGNLASLSSSKGRSMVSGAFKSLVVPLKMRRLRLVSKRAPFGMGGER
jgi:hypothetical protein